MALALKQPQANASRPVAEWVPYTRHSTEFNVRTDKGDVLTVFKVAGVAHEAADSDDLQAWHEGLAGLVRNIAGAEVAFYSHIVRRPRNEYPGGAFEDDFAGQLNEAYKAKVTDASLMVNELYFTVVLRKAVGLTGWMQGGGKKTLQDVVEAQADQDARLDEIADTIIASTSRYSPRRPGVYERNGSLFSEALEFLALLVNGEWQRIPLVKGRASYAMTTSRLSFGSEQLEIRTPTERYVGMLVAINEYLTERTETGHMNNLLTLPFPYVMTQSFACLGKLNAQKAIKKQQTLMENSEDPAITQINAMREAQDDLASNRIIVGEHHHSLLVLASDVKTLKDRVAMARSAIAEDGFLIAVEDDCNEAAYWSQMPGNFEVRPRPAMITSRNLVAFNSLHNYPIGRMSGNQWGPAITLLKTSSGTPFYFNFHLPPKGKRAVDEENTDERVPGHTLMLGPTGAGKTVIQTFMLAQCEKYKPTVFTFDKDQGQEIFVKAMGGKYLTLQNGQPSGFNPCAMPDTPENRVFLEQLVKRCVRGDDPTFHFSPNREREITEAINGIYGAIPHDQRRFSTLLQFFDPTDPDGVYARFRKWCQGGSLGWLMDNATDQISLTGTRHFGFDVTAFLDNDETRTATVMYLFHRMEQLIDGRRFILNMDEFWKMLLDPYFEKKALDAVKTYRKRNAIALFGTQSPGDVLSSGISQALIEQCVTQLYLPNPKAAKKDYIDGFKLTHREYEIIKDEMPEQGTRGFLFKQGTASTVCELNLRGFDDELAVLSGTASSVEIANKAIAMAGENPQAWLPMFHKLRVEQ